MIDQKTKLLLQDMHANARIAFDLLQGRTLEEFSTTVTLLYTATKATEIIGEAALQVDPAVRNSIASLPWRQAIAMRHRLIHGYRTVDAQTLFDTIHDDFPALIAEIERLLNANP